MNKKNKDNQELDEMLNCLDPETIRYGQCTTLCSTFVEGSYISATLEEIADVLASRWKEFRIITTSEILEGVRVTIENCKEYRLIEDSIIPGKYSPTYLGWEIGRKYYNEILGGTQAQNTVKIPL